MALIAWFGVLLQLYLSLNQAHIDGRTLWSGLARYTAYFTVLTNLSVAIVASLPLLIPQSKLGRVCSQPIVLGCAVTAIAFVGLAYHVLLRHVWDPQGLQLVANYALHYITPISFFIYWVIYPRQLKSGYLLAVQWAVYPAAYLVYSMLRGAMGDTYPYYFIDVNLIGYGQVLINAVALSVIFMLLGTFILWLAKLRQKAFTWPINNQKTHYTALS